MNKENKIIAQTELGGLISNMEKQSQEGFEGLITEINPTTNTVFFGGEGTYDEKEGYAITVKLRDENETEFTTWYSKPKDVRGYKSTNMYAFYKKYGAEPKKGQEVKCHIDDDGFFRITI